MKPIRTAQSVSVKLAVLRFPAAFDSTMKVLCMNCSASLALHQPDEEVPTRLIGVCEQCKHWFLIDLPSDLSEGVMVELPDSAVFPTLCLENRADRI